MELQYSEYAENLFFAYFFRVLKWSLEVSDMTVLSKFFSFLLCESLEGYEPR